MSIYRVNAGVPVPAEGEFERAEWPGKTALDEDRATEAEFRAFGASGPERYARLVASMPTRDGGRWWDAARVTPIDVVDYQGIGPYAVCVVRRYLIRGDLPAGEILTHDEIGRLVPWPRDATDEDLHRHRVLAAWTLQIEHHDQMIHKGMIESE